MTRVFAYRHVYFRESGMPMLPSRPCCTQAPSTGEARSQLNAQARPPADTNMLRSNCQRCTNATFNLHLRSHLHPTPTCLPIPIPTPTHMLPSSDGFVGSDEGVQEHPYYVAWRAAHREQLPNVTGISFHITAWHVQRVGMNLSIVSSSQMWQSTEWHRFHMRHPCAHHESVSLKTGLGPKMADHDE